MKTNLLKTRWAAIGAAVAVTLGAGGLGISYATSPAGATAFVPITPCRVVDTRPAPDTVGARTSPLGPEETFTVTAHGNNGNCTGIPTGATGLSLNVTALGATSGTFLTLWATGATQPTASNLNPQPGQPPTPNAVTTGLSAGGQFNIFNKVGSVNVIVDIVGYYTDHQHTGADIVDNSLTGGRHAERAGHRPRDFMNDRRQCHQQPPTGDRVDVDREFRPTATWTIQVTGAWPTAAAGSDEAFCQTQKGAAGAIDTAQPWFLVRRPKHRHSSRDVHRPPHHADQRC